MNAEIYYCTQWNYKPEAVRVADELSQALGIDPTLIPGKGGVFDVVVGEKLVFSKFLTGRFPDPGELSDKFK